MALTARYLCDDFDASTAVADSSGNGNDAATGGSQTVNMRTTGPGNNLTHALQLLSSVPDTITASTLTPSALPFSFMGWVRLDTTPVVGRVLLGHYYTGNGAFIASLEHDTTSGTDCTVAIDFTSAGEQAYSSPVVAIGDWHHYTCVFESTTVRKLYIDGQFVEPSAASGTGNSQVNIFDRFRIGNGINISVADVRVYNGEAVDQATITAAYAEGFDGVAANITFPTDAQNINHDSGDAGTVFTVVSDGANPDPVFSLSGDDAAQFTINSSTGVVAFAATPDYANPTDANTDNVYQLTVVATHPAGNDSVSLTVTVVSVGPPVNTVAPVISKVV